MPPAQKGSIWKGIKEVFPMVGLMLVILGSIYRGIATPTEAAAVGAFIAAIIAWFVRKPSFKVYFDAFMNTIIISSSILFIAIGAFLFNYAVQTTGIASSLTKWVVSLDLNVYVFLLLMFAFYAILGCLVDSIGMIVMTVPLLLPILVAYHIDLIWFGVILVVVVELGQITPPVGINLYIVDAMTKEGIGVVIKGVIPYFYIFGIFLLMLLLWPQMATWLPSHM
jgi:tripartite ATP-independent transporter DctM subunit